MRKLTKISILALTAGLLLAACSSTESTAESRQEIGFEETFELDRSANPDLTQPSDSNTSTAAVMQVWESFWTAWDNLRFSTSQDVGELLTYTIDVIAESQLSIIQAEVRVGGDQSSAREVRVAPQILNLTPNTAILEDCVLLFPWFNQITGMNMQAELTKQQPTAAESAAGLEGSWLITRLEMRDFIGCVPAATAREVLTVYQQYWATRSAFFDPPNPESAALNRFLANPQLDFTRRQLEENQARGAALRGTPQTLPGITGFLNLNRLVIVDCQTPNPDFGLYDLDTGQRLDNIAPTRSGQRDLRETVMVFEGNRWKISEIRGDTDSNCGTDLRVRYLTLL